MRTIELTADAAAVEIIDQRLLPWRLERRVLRSAADAAEAITTMHVRGAPLIGVATAFGVWLALRGDPSDTGLEGALALLGGTRPTAVNLRWALARMREAVLPEPPHRRAARALEEAGALMDSEIDACRRIGEHGFALLEQAWERRRQREVLNVLTHCNAGWLATVEWGTALAPLYRAQQAGMALHVWVDETRPRNQGGLTAWELAQAGIAHTLIVDNEAGILMQRGLVDLCIVGADRVTARGDVCNKIGTYLKAVAAKDNDIPFYAAMPLSTVDWSIEEGSAIPIEERSAEEIQVVQGRLADGAVGMVRVVPEGTAVRNHAFDVTPSRLVTALITEAGVCAASAEGLAGLRSGGVR